MENILVLLLVVLSFIAGLRLDNYYHAKAAADKKDALERQFIRLRAQADADDPCQPYMRRTENMYPIAPQIDQNFMEHLQKNGRATTKLKNKVR